MFCLSCQELLPSMLTLTSMFLLKLAQWEVCREHQQLPSTLLCIQQSPCVSSPISLPHFAFMTPHSPHPMQFTPETSQSVAVALSLALFLHEDCCFSLGRRYISPSSVGTMTQYLGLWETSNPSFIPMAVPKKILWQKATLRRKGLFYLASPGYSPSQQKSEQALHTVTSSSTVCTCVQGIAKSNMFLHTLAYPQPHIVQKLLLREWCPPQWSQSSHIN